MISTKRHDDADRNCSAEESLMVKYRAIVQMLVCRIARFQIFNGRAVYLNDANLPTYVIKLYGPALFDPRYFAAEIGCR